ncbi:alpha/beta fold hydrolase [Aestuariibius sp. 2305UL40-4]|uniref:alpha/beta fold hydrolase n=1 Tax=Aestuariibius violaceus TaxID=3234132 RepID=UPI00345EA0DC
MTDAAQRSNVGYTVGMTLTAPRSISVASGKATFLEAGLQNARTVLLFHGGGLDCASLSWRLLMPALSQSYRIIAPNWPGYAGTTAFGRPYTIADIGQWLMTLLDHLEIERASMIGVSMGGGASLWSALNHPERVEAIVPIGTYGIADRAPHHRLSYVLTKLPLNAVSYAVMRRYPSMLRRALEAIFANPEKVTDEIIAEVQDVLGSAGNGAPFTNFQRGEMTSARLRTSFGSELSKVSCPSLFIHGKEDSLVPLKTVEAAIGLMKNASLEVMDAGHWPMREDPETFNELVLAFLRAVRS